MRLFEKKIGGVVKPNMMQGPRYKKAEDLKRILDFLSWLPVSVEKIADGLNIDSRRVRKILYKFELRGEVFRIDGDYCRTSAALDYAGPLLKLEVEAVENTQKPSSRRGRPPTGRSDLKSPIWRRVMRIALTHDIPVRGYHSLEIIAALKFEQLNNDESEELKEVCAILGADYNLIKPKLLKPSYRFKVGLRSPLSGLSASLARSDEGGGVSSPRIVAPPQKIEG